MRIHKFKKILKSKTAYSIGFSWIFGLVSLFGIGILFIVFDQVFLAHLVPVIKNQVNGTYGGVPIDNDTKTVIFSNIDKYMSFWHALPFILFFLVIIYMLIAAIRREGDEGAYGGGG